VFSKTESRGGKVRLGFYVFYAAEVNFVKAGDRQGNIFYFCRNLYFYITGYSDKNLCRGSTNGGIGPWIGY
jgi:hypothetical protein